MKVYVLTRIDKEIHADADVQILERTPVGVYTTRADAMTGGYQEKQWHGADDYDVEEFDL